MNQNKPAPPKVFIVVLGFNGGDLLKKCLKSVFAIDYPSFSVVLVDNNSTDGSFEMAKRHFSRAFFIRNKTNLGFATGMNVGIRFALERMADYVVVLNQDVEVEADFLSKIISAGEKEPEIGILSPVIFNSAEKDVWFSGGIIDWKKMKVLHKQDSFAEKIRLSDFISGCAMTIKKEVFKKVGLFDEDFFLYYEDADFSLRSKKAGFKNVIVSDSWVYHQEISSREENFKEKTYWLVLSGLIFFYKNASFWNKIWITVFVFLRKVNNIKNIVFKKDLDKAKVIRRAFKDFGDVKK